MNSVTNKTTSVPTMTPATEGRPGPGEGPWPHGLPEGVCFFPDHLREGRPHPSRRFKPKQMPRKPTTLQATVGDTTTILAVIEDGNNIELTGQRPTTGQRPRRVLDFGGMLEEGEP